MFIHFTKNIQIFFERPGVRNKFLKHNGYRWCFVSKILTGYALILVYTQLVNK